MVKVLLVVHLLVTMGMVGVILLQRSEGGVLGIGGGGGFMSGRAAGNLLTRATTILAAIFFASSILLAILANNRTMAPSLMDGVQSSAPAAPTMDLTPNIPGSVPAETAPAASTPATPAPATTAPATPAEAPKAP